MSPFWVLLELRMMDVVVTAGTLRHAKQVVTSNIPSPKHFYKLHVLPDAKPAVSEH